MALLIDGAAHCDEHELPSAEDDCVYVRRAVRGQNLDRAGVAPQYMKALNLLGDRRSAAEIADQLGWTADEAVRVLHAMHLAELVEQTSRGTARQVVAFETDATVAGQLREALDSDPLQFYGKVVRDQIALRLVLGRSQPDILVFNLSCTEALALMKDQQRAPEAADTKWIGILPRDMDERAAHQVLCEWTLRVDRLLNQPLDARQFLQALEEVSQETGPDADAIPSADTTPSADTSAVAPRNLREPTVTLTTARLLPQEFAYQSDNQE